eukprot:m.47638 g.47638  ORF g.47638 m.47638 type:complete len:413 (+) comp20544_c0_seq1:413-1651(+)
MLGNDDTPQTTFPPLKFAALSLLIFAMASIPSMRSMRETRQHIAIESNFGWDSSVSDDEVDRTPLHLTVKPIATQNARAVLPHISSVRGGLSPIMCGSDTCHRKAQCNNSTSLCECVFGYIGDGKWCGPLSDVPNTTMTIDLKQQQAFSTQVVDSFGSETLIQKDILVVVLLCNLDFSLNAPEVKNTLVTLVQLAQEMSAVATVVFAANASSPNLLKTLADFVVMVVDEDAIGLMLPALWGRIHTEYLHDWSIILDGANFVEHRFTQWIESSFQSSKETVTSVKTVLSAYDHTLPLLFGHPLYDDMARPHRGEGFILIEPESWLTGFSADYLVLSAGFLEMYQAKGWWSGGGFQSANKSDQYGEANDASCMEKIQLLVGSATQLAQLSTCLYEQYGLMCRSLFRLMQRGTVR